MYIGTEDIEQVATKYTRGKEILLEYLQGYGTGRYSEEFDEYVGTIIDAVSQNGEETGCKHRTGCVCSVLGYDASKEEIDHWAGQYGVKYEICMKYKSFWKNLSDNSKSC